MAYLLDTNVFIEARNRYYGFDLCPGFWEWIDRAADDGRIVSLDNVRDELTDPELDAWAADRDGLFPRVGAVEIDGLRRVAEWADGAGYERAAVNTFLQGADYYLVGSALAHDHTLVTHEVPSRSRKQIKIPDACVALEIKFLNTFAMLKREGVQFVLGVA